MLTIRRDADIHAEEGGWFQARWHFSFASYHDPDWTNVGPLRVFNDDRLVPGADWPMHPHRDIESCTYVVEGTFEHDDSLGNGGRLAPGAAQVMRFSSRGARHSERNGDPDAPMRFLQFWLLPSEEGLESSVQQEQYAEEDRTDRWLQIMGPEGEDGLDLAQDAHVLVSRLSPEKGLTYAFDASRGGYLYVIEGAVAVDDDKLAAGDAVMIEGAHDLSVRAVDAGEVILVEVPLEFEPIGVWAG